MPISVKQINSVFGTSIVDYSGLCWRNGVCLSVDEERARADVGRGS